MKHNINNRDGDVIGHVEVDDPAPRVITFDYSSGSDETPTVLVLKDKGDYVEGINLNYITECDKRYVATSLFTFYRRYLRSNMSNIMEVIER